MTTCPAATEATAEIFARFALALEKSLARAERDARSAGQRRDLVVRGFEATGEMGREVTGQDGQVVAGIREEADKLAAQVEDIRARVAKLASGWNPFLPLGTLVRVARYPESAAQREIERLPELGSVGVVAGPNFDSQYALRVAFWSAFRTNHGAEWDPEDPELGTADAEPFVYLLDPDCLEALEPGRFLDGSPCEAIGVEPTHRAADDPDEAVMIVEAAGVHWHFWRFEGSPGVHCHVDPARTPESHVEIGSEPSPPAR